MGSSVHMGIFNKYLVQSEHTIFITINMTFYTLMAHESVCKLFQHCCLEWPVQYQTIAWTSADLSSNLKYKPHQIPKLKCFSSRFVVVFAQSIETRC